MNRIYKKTNVITTYGLILIELISVISAVMIAVFTRFGELGAEGNIDIYIQFGVVEAALLLLYSMLTDWNRDFFIRGYFKEILAVIKSLGLTSAFSAFIMFMVKKDQPLSRTVLTIYILSTITLTFLFHILFKEYMLKIYRKGANSDKMMIVTTSDRAADIIRRIKGAGEWNCDVVSAVIMDKDMTGEEIEGLPVVGGADDLNEAGTRNIVDSVFISLPKEVPIDRIRDIIYIFESMGVVCHYDIGLDEINLDGKEAGTIAGYSVLSFSLQNLDYRRLIIKRIFDIIGSIIGIIFTGLLFPFIALAIRIESKGSVIFKQERIGRNGRRFMIYKFRSMYLNAEEKLDGLKDRNEVKGLMFKISDDPRVTKVGRFLRRTSLDELPQFFNILKGDMSLVGTRPPTVEEYEQYDAHYKRRLSITPGLTGMWQVSGRSDITDFDEVVKLDLEYIDKWSLALDVKILLQTIGAVFFRKGSK
ncbi:MAG: sugar transferase [Lachnospiraceae bacterium]|nr:sugar transferase [Lachnospiraceae bacterium]